jgi:ABC-2 type transport system ATP-binding protein
LREDKLGIYRKIGLLIGEPRLYSHLSGAENLYVYTTYRQLDPGTVPDVLERVGLSQQASKKVRHYSTGMRQRLGIALALLHRPDFLILDEPTNGLDPQGIADVRRLILGLREEHTILVSSHLLSEVEQTSTHLAVLEEGKLLFQGSMEALRSRKRSTGFSLLVETRPEATWPPEIPFPSASLGAGKFRIDLTDREQIPPLIDRLREAGLSLYQFRIEEPDLEASFLDLFQKEKA